MALGLNNTVAPDWANKWSERLKIVIDTLTSPRTKVVADVASLPDARQWNTRQIWVTDIGTGSGRIVFSNGVDWIRTDTGASV